MAYGFYDKLPTWARKSFAVLALVFLGLSVGQISSAFLFGYAFPSIFIYMIYGLSALFLFTSFWDVSVYHQTDRRKSN